MSLEELMRYKLKNVSDLHVIMVIYVTSLEKMVIFGQHLYKNECITEPKVKTVLN